MQTVWEREPREDLWKDHLTLSENFNRVSFACIKVATLGAAAYLGVRQETPVWYAALAAVNYLICAQAQGQIRSRGEWRVLQASGETDWRKVPRLKNFLRSLGPF